MVSFIPDKIMPPAELPRVSRARLVASLKESLAGCNSTIVEGRAGTGKTLLAADFARQCGRRVAWYTVEAPDADLSAFFQYLCASVEAERPGFGQRVRERLGDSVGFEDVPLLVEYFVYELLESGEPLLIVIDDLHLVYDAEWTVPFFRRLLPLLPPEVHVLLIGRSLPPAPLWRMRSKQTLCVIDERSLAFTLQEARKLFASYGLSAERAEAALAETRGRAATLHAQARTASVNEEAIRLIAAREARHSRPLRLVKGFARKSSMGAA
ncbi:MAG TPA: AAA family ATPase [Pyrinomonadaceae bacterium]|jgi:LuxR family maltose regulon positive regulatory protein|nr:AAA family ATPase [Pyrinomonadaceae bacterium]